MKSTSSFASKKFVRVKIAGDGTVVCRSLHLVIIAFSLIEAENPNSPNGNHIIATEYYDNMSDAFKNVVEEVKTLNSICVNGITFAVEFFLGADWKFLAQVTGTIQLLQNIFAFGVSVQTKSAELLLTGQCKTHRGVHAPLNKTRIW